MIGGFGGGGALVGGRPLGGGHVGLRFDALFACTTFEGGSVENLEQV